MQAVQIFVQVSNTASDASSLTVKANVTSNELDDSEADGSNTGDVAGQDGYSSPVPISLTFNSALSRFEGLVPLRAERAGSLNGRVYSINCLVTDTAGNSSSATCVVVVPHDKKRK
jgi:hypothetical protein